MSGEWFICHEHKNKFDILHVQDHYFRDHPTARELHSCPARPMTTIHLLHLSTSHFGAAFATSPGYQNPSILRSSTQPGPRSIDDPSIVGIIIRGVHPTRDTILVAWDQCRVAIKWSYASTDDLSPELQWRGGNLNEMFAEVLRIVLLLATIARPLFKTCNVCMTATWCLHKFLPR
jgi:hypothetical protein